jgi:hypothetical protein
MNASRWLSCALAVALLACNGGTSNDAGDASDVADIGSDAGDTVAIDVFDAAPDVPFTRDVTVEASVSCSALTDCASCNSAPDCGWCGALGQCMPGDGAGPMGGACASGWTYFVAACAGDAGVDAPSLRWTSEMLPTSGTILSLWGSGSSIYAAAGGGIFHSTGDGHWTMQYSAGDGASVWGSSPSDVYAVVSRPAGSQIVHSAGDGNWSVQFASDGRSDVTAITSIWGSVANDVWAVGFDALPSHGVILHSSGDGAWRIVQTIAMDVRLVSIYGSGPNDIYVAGQIGVLFHFDGTHWSQDMGFMDNPGTVWLADSNDVYVGALQGVWVSAGDGNWTQQLSPTLNFEPAAIGGSSRNDVYAAGLLRGVMPGGAVFHSDDGMTWISVGVPPQGSFNAVWARSAGEVFLGASGGIVVHGRM